MDAVVLSIGDELVSGQTVNTNATWLSQQLGAIGVRTREHVTVGDQLGAIVEAVREAIGSGVELLLISGGLGPTEDDLTRQGVAGALGERLVEDAGALVQIEEWFRSKNRPMSPSNRLQALRPESGGVIENLWGTAPGLRARKEKTEIFVMPGVPREMQGMFARSVLPAIKELRGEAAETVTLITKINTFGRGESVVGEAIQDLMVRGAGGVNLEVGTTVHDGIVSVRIYATGTREEVKGMTESVRVKVRERLGAIVFGEDSETLETAVGQLLKDERYTVATAESCTGGMLAMLLTEVAGSSAYFLRGWVTYANSAKHEELSIAESVIAEHGAVSEAVARAMAEAARKFAQSDLRWRRRGLRGPVAGVRRSRWGRCGSRWRQARGWRRGGLFFRGIGGRYGCGRRRWGWRFCGGG